MSCILPKTIFRLLAVLLIVLSTAMGTFASDIHPVDTKEIACQESIVPTVSHQISDDSLELSDTDSHDTVDPDHDHHAHSCGSCHFHAYTAGQHVPRSLSAADAIGLRNQSALHDLGLKGLFRPPRI